MSFLQVNISNSKIQPKPAVVTSAVVGTAARLAHVVPLDLDAVPVEGRSKVRSCSTRCVNKNVMPSNRILLLY